MSADVETARLVARPAQASRTLGLPFSGLRLGWGRLVAEETGAVVPLDRELLSNVAAWLPYGLREWARTIVRRDTIAIAAVPNLPRPYYLLWGVLRRAGLRPARPWSRRPARMSVLFTDKTFAHEHPDTPHDPDGFVLNGRCRDISKSRVARVFEDVFGYPLSVDPTTYRGLMVEKSEHNGVHDGALVRGPRAARPGFVYQRAVDTRNGRGEVVDLRCPTAFGEIAVVCAKRRPVGRRFDNYNSACDLHEPEDVFSDRERADIARFCRAMDLDWGGLDVLRDRADGRIYIVDVNKTDMPVLVLPTREKLEVSDRLARLLRSGVEARLATR